MVVESHKRRINIVKEPIVKMHKMEKKRQTVVESQKRRKKINGESDRKVL